jgi:NAD(P)H-dependent flavin oxidoreductase YrpB (nitropropane dioxygenase family)
LRTRLTGRPGIRHPILSAPMGGTAGGAATAGYAAAEAALARNFA